MWDRGSKIFNGAQKLLVIVYKFLDRRKKL